MSDEQKERIEELEELLEETKEELVIIQDEVEQLTCDLQGSISEDELYEQKESIMNIAFNAGYNSNNGETSMIKSWLNYKVEAGI